MLNKNYELEFIDCANGHGISSFYTLEEAKDLYDFLLATGDMVSIWLSSLESGKRTILFKNST